MSAGIVDDYDELDGCVPSTPVAVDAGSRTSNKTMPSDSPYAERGRTTAGNFQSGPPLSDLDVSLNELEGVADSFAARFLQDGRARHEYRAQLAQYVEHLRRDTRLGRMSIREAAYRAQAMRNGIMNAMRGNSSDVGVALARFRKAEA